MRPEYHVVGKMAWGPIDYVILYYTLAVVVAEVIGKTGNFRSYMLATTSSLKQLRLCTHVA